MACSDIREGDRLKGKAECVEYLGIYADMLVRTAEAWTLTRRVFEGIETLTAPIS